MRRIHYVLSTHWDREWHQTFQGFRYRLVELMDEILQGFENDSLKGPFQTDGQAILLEDYLEIRPEKTERIKTLCREGKLVVGPWYTMPDEFLVSGESLIRNLELGCGIAASLGGRPSEVGFVCDIFGHCSQLPQIFRHCGITSAVIWRGVTIKDNRLANWRGADGTVLPTYVFSSYGYGSFAVLVRRVQDAMHRFDKGEFSGDLDEYIRKELAETPSDAAMVFDGCDHQFWDREAYGVISRLFKEGFEGNETVHTSLDEFMSDVCRQKECFQDEIRGELRIPGWVPEETGRWLLSDVLSSWVPLKLANHECQTMLCDWAEPYAAASRIWTGRPYPNGFLDVSWKWLLQNHAHDSICGCSVDRVHEDMKFRFAQSRDIAKEVTQDAFRTIAGSIESVPPQDELNVTLFNPQAKPQKGISEFFADLPKDWLCFMESKKFQPLPSFRIYGSDGEEIPYQRLSVDPGRTDVRLRKTKIPEKVPVYRMKLALPVGIPAMGYTTLRIKSCGENTFVRGETGPGMACGLHAMENEYLHVEVESNGTFTLTDKRTGMVYRDQMLFEDVADIGDGWDFCRPLNSYTYTSVGSRSEVMLVHNGPFLTAFRIRVHLQAPRCFDFRTAERSGELTDVLIESTVTMRKGSPELDIETTV
ncbi:MAG: glycoside hydrolase family 38 C-terminal domain-containing protein, partial [Kiritimatiellales bacterium]